MKPLGGVLVSLWFSYGVEGFIGGVRVKFITEFRAELGSSRF